MKKRFSEICDILRSRGYRLTPQREAIIRVILENIDMHLTAEELYTILKKDHPGIGIATVYRSLDLLSKEKIMNELDFADGYSRYEFGGQKHHHHLVCLGCGKVVEFSDNLLERVEKSIGEKHDFHIIGHHLKLYGYCSDCSVVNRSRGSEEGED